MTPAYERGVWHGIFFVLTVQIVIALAWALIVWASP